MDRWQHECWRDRMPRPDHPVVHHDGKGTKMGSNDYRLDLKTEPGDGLLMEQGKIQDRVGLQNALQMALAIEHATIPAYLYALFSIKRERNQEVADIIRSVVMEEMLHMALVSNLLNAVGTTPQIGWPQTVPRYPGPLPGGLLPDLLVSLRKCSISQVRSVFMAIEQPHVPLDQHSRRTLASVERIRIGVSHDGMIENLSAEELDAPIAYFQRATYEDFTIGWFYQKIATAIIDLDKQKDLFIGDPARQVVWPGAPGRLYRVTDARTALWAIFEIIRQGEGSHTDPTTGPLPPVLDPPFQPQPAVAL
jgi:rubrerythrin